MSDSVWPHRWQPTRLPHPWDSPGKNTGVGCHFLLQCMKVKSESEVAQSCPTLSNPMDCSPPRSSVHGIFQARVLEWGAIAFSIFTLGGPSIGVSASASVLRMNIQGWFPLGWTGWISLQSKGLSKESPPTPQFKSMNSLVLSFIYSPTLTSIHDYWEYHSFD